MKNFFLEKPHSRDILSAEPTVASITVPMSNSCFENRGHLIALYRAANTTIVYFQDKLESLLQKTWSIPL